jgi:hypothetical protein
MPKLLPSIENVAEGGCASPETFSNQAGTSTVLGIPLRDYQSGSTSSIRVLEYRALSLSLSLSLSPSKFVLLYLYYQTIFYV